MELYLSLGTNLGDRNAKLQNALLQLNKEFGSPVLSDVIETEPWGFESSEKFLNAVVRYEVIPEGNLTEYAFHILELCKEIEFRMGREQRPLYDIEGKRLYYSRPIDIDILFLGELKINSHHLCIPHISMKERDFVMIPLRQIASESIKNSFPEIFF